MRLQRWALFFLLFSVGAAAQVRSSAKPRVEDQQKFAAEMEKIRDTWVQEYNAGHADKVAALYAPEAVLMRFDGSVHGRESILAELQRSISGGTHGYSLNSLHCERSGDLGYDTGAYNVTLRDRVVEGNYLIVVKNINGEWLIVAHSSVPNPATP
jgi:hypothetical protein